MKPTIRTLLVSTISCLGLLVSACREKGGEEATAEINPTEISNQLDLEIVISVFGESESLEDFERKLNDPERQISNLDLNEDGEVDYLRVVESGIEDTRLVSVQAVIAEDQYQDVATFDVQREPEGQTQVRVVGDPYVYGQDYAIQPTFSRPPILLGLFWAATYRAWKSPYYYGHYPSYYRPWRPYPYVDYRKRVTHYRNPNYVYHYTPYKRNKHSVTLYNDLRRNDYATRYPSKSFTKRNKGVQNRYQLDQKKGKIKVADNKGPGAKAPKPTTKPAQKPAVKPDKPTTKPAMKPVKPAQKPAVKPAKPAAKPASKPAAKPAPKPAVKPSGKAGGKAGGKPSSQPAPKTKGKK